MASNTNTLKIGPAQLATLLEIGLRRKQPIIVSGPPGIGKSQIVAQVAERMYGKQGKQYLVDFRAATHDPVDLHGVPAVVTVGDSQRTAWTVPEFFPTERDIKEGRFAPEGVIFLDEIGLAPPSMQGALFGFVLDRNVGKYRLPDGWSVISATNRQEDRSGAYRLLAALADRFTSVELMIDATAWRRWAINTKLDPRVVAFINLNDKILHDFDPAKDLTAFPTPRGWERVGRHWLAEVGDKNATTVAKDGWLRPAIAGTVGQGAMTELFGFLTTYEELPNIDDVWNRPLQARVPEKASPQFMVATTLAIRVTPERMKAFAQYLLRMPKEIGAMALRDLQSRDDKLELQRAPGFGDLAVAYGQINIGG